MKPLSTEGNISWLVTHIVYGYCQNSGAYNFELDVLHKEAINNLFHNFNISYIYTPGIQQKVYFNGIHGSFDFHRKDPENQSDKYKCQDRYILHH